MECVRTEKKRNEKSKKKLEVKNEHAHTHSFSHVNPSSFFRFLKYQH